jgi:hypothetical protein
LKLLLAIRLPVSSFRREQLSDCEDHTSDATLAFPVGNYVSDDLGNYVSDNRLNVGNYVSADTTSRASSGHDDVAPHGLIVVFTAERADCRYVVAGRWARICQTVAWLVT